MNKVFGQGRQRGEEPAEMVIINKVERERQKGRGTKGRAASEPGARLKLLTAAIRRMLSSPRGDSEFLLLDE